MYLNEKICVIAANNSFTKDDQLDYIQLASIAAERVKYFLNIDTYLITSDVAKATEYPIFAGIIHQIPSKISNRAMVAGNNTIAYKWFNDSRVEAFNLTKGLAKKILMIDADYMVASSDLLNWLNCDSPFIIYSNVYDVTGSDVYSERDYKYLPSKDIKMRWATALCWDQSEDAEIIFETAKMVRDNYPFYALLANIQKGIFRNDVAFSIACHLHNVPEVKNKLYNVPPGAIIKFNQEKKSWIIDYNNKLSLWNYDMHVINKQYAIDNNLMNHLRLNNVKA